METENKIVTEAVEGALEQIEKNSPEEFSKLNADPKLKDSIIKAARETATEQVKLAQEFASQPDQDIRNRLAKYLPEDRIKLIEGALSIPTFRVEITKKEDGKHGVQFTRDGAEFLPGKQLTTVADIESTSFIQMASILVEAVLLVMQAVGIKISPSSSTIEATVKDTVTAIKNSSKLQRAIAQFIDSWEKAGGNALSESKAIFYLIKESNAGGILWTIIKELCRNMTWQDWLKTSAKVAAMIIAALATGGTALIAKIALIVLSAVDFAKKIANLVQLEEIKKSL